MNDNLPPSLMRFGVELERAIGRELASRRRPVSGRARGLLTRRPRVLAGTTVGITALAVTLALALGVTTSAPAFAVTRNHDGTVTISIQRYSGIAGANAQLHQLGIRAQVTRRPPAGCGQRNFSAGGRGAPARSERAASAQWTIDPRQVPAGRTLVLAPSPSGNASHTTSHGRGRPACSCPTAHMRGSPERTVSKPAPGTGRSGRRRHGVPPPRPPGGGHPNGCGTFSLAGKGAPANHHSGPPPRPGNG